MIDIEKLALNPRSTRIVEPAYIKAYNKNPCRFSIKLFEKRQGSPWWTIQDLNL